MATIPNAYLKSDPVISLRDPQHAARMFTDDNFRLAPKQKFLFHVAFNINPAALVTPALASRHRNEINMLVKTVDLPNFTMKVETVNQYNRKKNVQTGHTYNAINIKFHDDNMGLINQMWQNYYGYYYADPQTASQPGTYNRTATRKAAFITNNYGLDNGSTQPFFNYIKIYQMARGEYVSYTLHNPIISGFNHNGLDYASNSAPHDNQMSVQFEAVSYDSGVVSAGDPEGFALEHYDLTPSPLTGTDEGLVSASPNFSTPAAVQSQGLNFLSSAIETVNSYTNTKPLAKAGSSVISNINSVATPGTGGLQGFAFPLPK